MRYIFIWITALVLSHTTFSFGSQGKNSLWSCWWHGWSWPGSCSEGSLWGSASGERKAPNGNPLRSFLGQLVYCQPGWSDRADSITLDRTAGKFKQVNNVKKGLKISRWSLIKANAKGYRAEKRNKCTKGRWGIAVQAEDLQVTVGKQLNINE